MTCTSPRRERLPQAPSGGLSTLGRHGTFPRPFRRSTKVGASAPEERTLDKSVPRVGAYILPPYSGRYYSLASLGHLGQVEHEKQRTPQQRGLPRSRVLRSFRDAVGRRRNLC